MAPVKGLTSFRARKLLSVPGSENDFAISAVRSVEPSSTTMISKSISACVTSDSRQEARQASSFRAGTMTETTGLFSWLMGKRSSRSHAYQQRTPLPLPSSSAFIVYYIEVRISALVVACLAALSAASCYHGSKPSEIGKTAPDFTIQDSDHSVTLSQYRGKIVVLNFWATWCPPCVEEMPSLVELQRRMQAQGKDVVVLAVSVDDDG